MARLYLGLCCINNTLREDDVFCSRSMIQKNFTVKKAQEYALKNINDIITLAEWNYRHRIFHLRLSSDILPHYTNPNVESYTLDFAKEAFEKVGEALKKYNQRVTFHPGQFCVIGTPSEDVFEKTILDLKMHADMLDMMGVGPDGILCIHGGGVYGDKEKTIERWISNFSRLPKNVQKRLCIENCERCYSVEDCLRIADACNIPVILDSHHFDCYNLINKDANLVVSHFLDHVVQTWTRRGITPVFHISEQKEGARIGAHSDLIENIPEYMLNIPEKYGVSLSIEVEAKGKEAAIFKLYEKYPFLNMPLSLVLPLENLEKEDNEEEKEETQEKEKLNKKNKIIKCKSKGEKVKSISEWFRS
jgi:UV DNA damage endonuclease